MQRPVRGTFHLAKIFGLKFRKFSVSNRKVFFHASKKRAISLVDRDGTRSWCKAQAREMEICANGTVISVSTGLNGKSGVAPKVVRLFWKISNQLDWNF